jgi:hypothetical protein
MLLIAVECVIVAGFQKYARCHAPLRLVQCAEPFVQPEEDQDKYRRDDNPMKWAMDLGGTSSVRYFRLAYCQGNSAAEPQMRTETILAHFLPTTALSILQPHSFFPDSTPRPQARVPIVPTFVFVSSVLALTTSQRPD